jgi:demethylmenaquinone methyltransferase/2-methoxy-6-polyprenyl-1,4-benzoquinol methylase
MLNIACSRLPHLKYSVFIRTDMCAAPFRGNSADIITGGYALRNAPDLPLFLREIHRLLRSGGTASFLDFSRAAPSLFASVQHAILYGWGSLWGWVLHRDPSVYGYIAKSLNAFPHRDDLETLIRSCGFTAVKTRLFFLGTVAIVSFCKP